MTKTDAGSVDTNTVGGSSVKASRIRGVPEKGTKSQPRKAGNFRGG